jgi:hypothetical protein
MDYPNDFPTKNKKRGLRRAKFKTICKKVSNYFVVSLGNKDQIDPDLLHYRTKIFATTPKRCGCWMCRNPRHVFHGEAATLTLAERKALQDDGE